jgi:TonB family protein
VRLRALQNWSAVTLLGCLFLCLAFPSLSLAQAELNRKVRSKVAPAYPELARRINLRGTVKLLVVVLPNGNVKDTKVMGGNPILVNAAVDALKKWKFEPTPDETSGTIEFKFEPTE